MSRYQWRSPGEWFAEIYANYFLGVLPENHPVYNWFRQFIQNNADMTPAAVQNPTEWNKQQQQQELEAAVMQEYQQAQEAERQYEEAWMQVGKQ